MAWAAYLSLLCIWTVFLSPAVAGPHPHRGWARLAVGLGLAGAIYEGLMFFVWGPASIRLDIFLIFAGLTVVYLLASWMLAQGRWRRTGLTAGALTLVAAGIMGIALVLTGSDLTRATARFEEGNRLLFAAKFAHQDAYDGYFGATGDGGAGLPVGHWVGEGRQPTRLVVGADGRVYFFYRCGDTECQYGPGAALEPSGSGLAAVLEHRGVGDRAIELEAPVGDTLPVRVDGKPQRLRRAPPPLLGAPAEERLAYLGTFSGTEPDRQHVRVAQLWLWRADEGLFAVGIFEPFLVPGRREDFVMPHVLGRGTPEGDAWRFAWSRDEEPAEAIVRLGDGEATVELTRLRRRAPWPPMRLAPKAIFHDEVIELAARRSIDDWQHWMDTLLAVHFCSGDIPAGKPATEEPLMPE